MEEFKSVTNAPDVPSHIGTDPVDNSSQSDEDPVRQFIYEAASPAEPRNTCGTTGDTEADKRENCSVSNASMASDAIYLHPDNAAVQPDVYADIEELQHLPFDTVANGPEEQHSVVEQPVISEANEGQPVPDTKTIINAEANGLSFESISKLVPETDDKDDGMHQPEGSFQGAASRIEFKNDHKSASIVFRETQESPAFQNHNGEVYNGTSPAVDVKAQNTPQSQGNIDFGSFEHGQDNVLKPESQDAMLECPRSPAEQSVSRYTAGHRNVEVDIRMGSQEPVENNQRNSAEGLIVAIPVENIEVDGITEGSLLAYRVDGLRKRGGSSMRSGVEGSDGKQTAQSAGIQNVNSSAEELRASWEFQGKERDNAKTPFRESSDESSEGQRSAIEEEGEDRRRDKSNKCPDALFTVFYKPMTSIHRIDWLRGIIQRSSA